MYTPPLYHWPKKSTWQQLSERENKWRSFSTYFHYPFCRHLCDFCGYETRIVKKSRKAPFSDRMLAELKSNIEHGDFSQSALNAVFFGGGTASLMPESLLEQCALSLRNLAGIEPPEMTLECEPGTINYRRLKRAKDFGINRIGICAQSLRDNELEALGRKHRHLHSAQLLDDALLAGIGNLHLDLMYNFPSQTLKSWEDTLQRAVCLPVHHISVYKLYVFKYGALHRQGVHRGFEETTTELDTGRRMHDLADEVLEGAGFRRYTLTEYARPNYQCRYIRHCFDGSDILPIGPAGFGRCGRTIWENQPYLNRYLSEHAQLNARGIKLSSTEAFKRDIILGLWLLDVDIAELEGRHNVQARPELTGLLLELCDDGLVSYAARSLSLRKEHRFSAGLVMARLDGLPTAYWAHERVSAHRNLASPRKGADTPSSIERKLAQIMRIVRRDRDLLLALEADPEGVLTRLGCDSSEPAFALLAKHIRNQYAGCGSDRVRQIWTAVQTEHLHLTNRASPRPDT